MSHENTLWSFRGLDDDGPWFFPAPGIVGQEKDDYGSVILFALPDPRRVSVYTLLLL